MKSALQFHSNQFKLIEEDTYATTDDFERLFARKRCFASFDNAHRPHVVSLPNQRLARPMVWHSGCF